MHEAIEPGSRIMEHPSVLGRPECEQDRAATFDDEDNEVTPYWECPNDELEYYVIVEVKVSERVYYAGGIVPHPTIEGSTLQQWLNVESRDEVPEGKEIRIIEAREYEDAICLACAVRDGTVTEAEIKTHAEAQAEYEAQLEYEAQAEHE